MTRLTLFASFAVLLLATPAVAQETPTPWRDQETGCWYLRNAGGLTPRLRRDGTADCPGTPPAQVTAPAAAPSSRWGDNVDERATRDLARAMERLEREMAALRQAVERQAR